MSETLPQPEGFCNQVLDWLRYSDRFQVPMPYNSRLQAEWGVDYAARTIQANWEAYLLSQSQEPVKNRVEYAEPVSWWDHWKLAHPPACHRSRLLYRLASPYHRWWRTRRPRWVVRTLTVTVERACIYPYASIEHPRMGQPICVSLNDWHLWDTPPWRHLERPQDAR